MCGLNKHIPKLDWDGMTTSKADYFEVQEDKQSSSIYKTLKTGCEVGGFILYLTGININNKVAKLIGILKNNATRKSILATLPW
jgi:hypothetical protein